MPEAHTYQVERHCVRCGGVTWHHQAHDICGQCGRSVQHQAPEVRLLRRSV
jgi:ribosomal protein L37E